MSVEHYDAIEALIPDGITVHRGSAPDKPLAADYPYIVLGGTAGSLTGDSYAGTPDSLDPRFKLTYAALTFDSVLIIMSPVRAAMVGRRLIVPGWSSGILRHESLLDITTDFDVTVPETSSHPLFAVDEFTVLSGR
jgi:hypothetical protein